MSSLQSTFTWTFPVLFPNFTPVFFFFLFFFFFLTLVFPDITPHWAAFFAGGGRGSSVEFVDKIPCMVDEVLLHIKECIVSISDGIASKMPGLANVNHMLRLRWSVIARAISVVVSGKLWDQSPTADTFVQSRSARFLGLMGHDWPRCGLSCLWNSFTLFIEPGILCCTLPSVLSCLALHHVVTFSHCWTFSVRQHWTD